jgi:multimeric flavodoxin WrbA
MKILGISGSPRKEEKSGTYTLVKTVLENTGIEYKMVSLRGKSINGCIACLGCAKDNVCKVEDDLAPLRQDILEADAYVFGAPNYYSGMNALTHAFMERWYQFRHQAADLLWGKLAVAVGAGGADGQPPTDDFEKFFMYSFIETVAKVNGQGAASCYDCGYGETCPVGIPNMLHGEGVKITPEIIPDIKKQEDVMASAANAGKLLGERLKNNHDRMKVAMRVKEKMMSMFEEST